MATPTNRDKAAPADWNADESVSALQLLTALLRHRRLFVGLALGLAGLSAVITIVTFQPTYTSRASFVPQLITGGRGTSGFQAVAGQLGLSLPTESASESPAFYADLLESREILRRVALSTYNTQEVRWGDTIAREGTIADLLELEGHTPDHRLEAAIEWLRLEAVAASTNPETGVVELVVTTPWPQLSKGIAESLLTLINDFNLETRQSQASAERRFIEDRLEQAREELLNVEESLKRFLENNRAFQNSPELVFEHDRLQRRVAIRQQVVTDLAQSYEQSRIAEVRNTPLITVVDPAEIPVERNPRGLLLRTLIAMLVGVVIGVFAALGSEVLDQSREREDPRYVAFSEAWRHAKRDLARLVPWNWKRFRQ